MRDLVYFKASTTVDEEYLDCHGSLVSIHNQETNQMIFDSVTLTSDSSHWIGLRQYCISCSYEWDDHSPVTYTNWKPGTGNNNKDGQACAKMYMYKDETPGHVEGYWNDQTCDNEYEYICAIYTSDQHIPPATDLSWPSKGDCKGGWSKMGKVFAAKFDQG